MKWTFEATERGYANLWASATLKGGADAANADLFSDKIIAAEAKYRAVQNATGVPWFFIGALHMRESSCNFAGVLHNGEHIIGTGKLTSLVPAGRGPFATWEEAAIDALKLKDMHRIQRWSVARMLYQAEVFNGLGYVGRGINSPYVWAGTSHEQRGKYVRDGEFNANAEDTQLGVAAVLIRLAQKRPDIRADLYPSTPVEKPPMDEPDLLKEIQGLRADIAALPAAITAALKGTAPPPVVDPAPAPVTPPAAPATPAAPSPSAPTSLGIMAGAVAAIMQLMGIPVIGEGATAATSAVPAVAIGSTALGLSGMGGTIVSILGTILSAFTKK